MNDYRHYNQYYWMNECMRVYFVTVNCKTKVNYLKLITFSWYVDHDLVVWFSRNLEEWNLSLKLPGAFPFRQPFTNKIFWSMMKSFSFSIFISYFCFSTGAFKGRKFVILIAFPWSFSIFLKSSFFSWVKCKRLFIWHFLLIFFRPSKVWSIFHHALVAASLE